MNEENIEQIDAQSELATQRSNNNKLKMYAVICLAVLLIVLLIIHLVKGFSFNKEIEASDDMSSSVKGTDFTLAKEENTFQSLLEKRQAEAQKSGSGNYINYGIDSSANSSDSSKNNAQDSQNGGGIFGNNKSANSANALNSGLGSGAYGTPRIVKGSGAVVIGDNKDAKKENTQIESEESADDKISSYLDGMTNLIKSQIGGDSQNKGGFGAQDFEGEAFVAQVASVSPYNQNLLLPKGTYIGCSLKNRLVSTIKGGIACIVSNDVYSANGNVLLIEKGSTITGQFKGGEVEEGMNRLFVIWQDIKTPNNIIIPVNSGATDELGASGIEGWVDEHWFKRFGSAILLSIIDDSLLLLSSALGGDSNAALYTQSSRENAANLANTALEKSINIKPTLYKNHGDLVGVYVNRDIDFSQVYRLKRKK